MKPRANQEVEDEVMNVAHWIVLAAVSGAFPSYVLAGEPSPKDPPSAVSDAGEEATKAEIERDRTLAAEAGVSPETDRFMKEAGGQVEKIFQVKPASNPSKE